MAKERDIISFELPSDFAKAVENRAKQEGITRSEYIREALALEMLFSGDLEAMKFILKRSGKRMKAALVDRLAQTDIKRTVDALAE